MPGIVTFHFQETSSYKNFDVFPNAQDKLRIIVAPLCRGREGSPVFSLDLEFALTCFFSVKVGANSGNRWTEKVSC